jgi:hypothetical protein
VTRSGQNGPAGLGFLAVSLVVTIGTFWAFTRGAPDFTVFHSAWRMVLEGRGTDIYRTQLMPDRFLYAPGFAWLLSPLALLPRQLALALWCFAKAGVVGYVVRKFRPRALPTLAGIGVAGLGAAVVARPMLIDFQYGQVNTLILGACVWALLGHFSSERPGGKDVLRWAVLAFAALAKVFPLPLLAVPFLVRDNVPRRRLALERTGIALGLAATLAAPMLTLGWDGAIALHAEWRQALIARGLPLETHNQSFAAFLNHYFTDAPVHVVAQGMVPIVLGKAILSARAIALLSLAWLAVSAGFVLAWIMSGARRPTLAWIAVLCSALILPSHLVWKPYFVMALPLAILAVTRTLARSDEGPARPLALMALFATINLTGFDVVGHALGAHFEAGAILLWSQLALIVLVLR